MTRITSPEGSKKKQKYRWKKVKLSCWNVQQKSTNRSLLWQTLSFFMSGSCPVSLPVLNLPYDCWSLLSVYKENTRPVYIYVTVFRLTPRMRNEQKQTVEPHFKLIQPTQKWCDLNFYRSLCLSNEKKNSWEEDITALTSTTSAKHTSESLLCQTVQDSSQPILKL